MAIKDEILKEILKEYLIDTISGRQHDGHYFSIERGYF